MGAEDFTGTFIEDKLDHALILPHNHCFTVAGQGKDAGADIVQSRGPWVRSTRPWPPPERCTRRMGSDADQKLCRGVRQYEMQPSVPVRKPREPAPSCRSDPRWHRCRAHWCGTARQYPHGRVFVRRTPALSSPRLSEFGFSAACHQAEITLDTSFCSGSIGVMNSDSLWE